MSWLFQVYRPNGKVYWKRKLASKQCGSRLPNGKRCKKWTTRIHPFCYSCTVRIYSVAIGESTQGPGSGLGLFAYDPKKDENAIIFKSDQWIAPYGGEVITDKECEKRYTGCLQGDITVCCPYAIGTDKNETVDAALVRGPAAYCNDSKDKDYNAYLCGNPLGIRALRKIRQHEEILVDYGTAYWKSKHLRFETIRIAKRRRTNS